MNHLCTCVCLLEIVGHGNAVELCLRVVATQYARRIFPCYGTSCLNLCPRQFRTLAAQVATLRHEVENTALALLVAWIPVLHGAVLHLGTVFHYYLHNGGMQLVFVTHRCRASLKIRNVTVVVGNYERTFKLSGIASIDAEITAQFHRRAHSFRNVNERTVAEHGTVKGCIEVVLIRHHGAEILPHQFAMLLDCLAYGAEDDAFLAQFFLESGLHRHRVHNGIHGSVAAQCQTFLEGDAQFVERLLQFGVNLSVALGFLCHRVGKVTDVLVVDWRHMHMPPRGLLQRLPVAESLQAELQHPFGFTFLSRDEPNDILVQPFLYYFGMYIRREAELILLFGHLTHKLITIHFLQSNQAFLPRKGLRMGITVSDPPLSR